MTARSEDKVTVHFINRDGETLTAKGKVGDSLLDVVVENNLDIDGFGACEGTLACSTCHLIFEEHIYDKLQPVTDEENDMLDLAYGLTDRYEGGLPQWYLWPEKVNVLLLCQFKTGLNECGKQLG
uniref:Adrenal ferredoxin n=1 Tax=Oryctolagus cuniculus TaxID=9986 RepID=G1TEI2_RABIT